MSMPTVEGTEWDQLSHCGTEVRLLSFAEDTKEAKSSHLFIFNPFTPTPNARFYWMKESEKKKKQITIRQKQDNYWLFNF